MTGEQYLKNHTIPESFAKEYDITWDTRYLYIPVKDAGGKIMYKIKANLHYKEPGNSEAKYIIPGGAKSAFFNWHLAKDSSHIIISEGLPDTIKLASLNIAAVSSTTGAGTFEDSWAELLKDKKIRVCYDNDSGGWEGTRKVFGYFPDIKSIELPENIKDICDYFALDHTKKDFLKLMKENSIEFDAWKRKHRKPEYDIVTAKEFSTMEIAPITWLIQNVMYSQGFCIIYGTEGTGKSFLTLSIAKAVSEGTPWLDKFKTNKTNVLFIDKENPDLITQRRLAGMNMNQENICWLKHPEEYELTNSNGEASEFAKELSEIIIDRSIGLLVIDSLVDIVAGSENSSGDTMAFFKGIKKLYPDIAYLTIHHENKPSQGVTRSAAQKMRGSSNLNAQPNTIFRLEAIAKSKTEMTLLQTKARDAQKLNKFMIRMKVKPGLDGSTTVTGFEYVGEIDDAIDDSKLGGLQETIKVAIAEGTLITRKDILSLAAGQGASQRTALRAIADMLASGEIAKSKHGREVIYKLSMFNLDEAIDELGEDII